MSTRAKAIVAIVIASILWGTAGVAGKTLLHITSPFVATFYRYLLASLIILPFFLHSKKPREYARILIPLSTLAAANVILYYVGLSKTTANAATLIYASTPLATALLAKLIIQEEVTKKKLIGVLIGLIGILCIIILPILEKGALFVGDLRGNLILVFAVLSWALYTVFSRRYISTRTYTPILMVSVNFFTSCSAAFVMAVVTKQQFVAPGMLTFPFIGTLVFTSIFVTVITYLLFQWAIQHISATTASLKNYLEPLVGVGLNTTILGEHITSGFLVGSALVIIGVTITTASRVVNEIQKKLGI